MIDALKDVSEMMNGTAVFTNSWVGQSKMFDPGGGQLPAYSSQMRVSGNGTLKYPSTEGASKE